MAALEKLVSISSDALSTALPVFNGYDELRNCESLITELDELLHQKNGFLAFENALLILPSTKSNGLPGIREWNDNTGWRRHYDRLPTPILFFALDSFAGQFAIVESGIVRFDPETAEISERASSLDLWVECLLSDYDFETGWSVAKEWQEVNGVLKHNCRLLPRVPFVLGGDYIAENLVEIDMTEALEKYGGLYRQIRDLPEGENVTVSGWIA